MKHRIGHWQMGGFLFTAAAGSLLHFLYDWTGQPIPVALFAAVNESVWEHMKLLYVPLVAFTALEARTLAKAYSSFWCAKLWSILAGLITIPLLYYTYTGALGVSADWFNICIFFLAAAVTYTLETHLLCHPLPYHHPKVAVGILIGIGLLFALFTFAPPHIPLFRDPVTGTYGI